MIIGVRFNIPNQYGKIISDIFDDVYIKQYNWKVFDSEVICQNDHNEDLFQSKIYNSNQFLRLISETEYYVVFLGLCAFPDGKVITNINNYKDFVGSDCEICMFITDCIFVDIYANSFEIIEKIKSNAEKNGFERITLITEEDDRRIKFSAF